MRVLSAVRQCPRPTDFQTVSEKTAREVYDVVKMSIFFGGEQNGSLVQRFHFFLFTEKRLEGHVFRTFAQLDDRYGNQPASFFTKIVPSRSSFILLDRHFKAKEALPSRVAVHQFG